eukprot:2914904-Rhodomonas_salina.1
MFQRKCGGLVPGLGQRHCCRRRESLRSAGCLPWSAPPHVRLSVSLSQRLPRSVSLVSRVSLASLVSRVSRVSMSVHA